MKRNLNEQGAQRNYVSIKAGWQIVVPAQPELPKVDIKFEPVAYPC